MNKNHKATPQEIIPRFHMLVKNRLGPYKILVGDKEGFVNLKTGNNRTFDRNIAYDYTLSDRYMFDSYQTYLTTAAGDIELFAKNFKS